MNDQDILLLCKTNVFMRSPERPPFLTNIAIILRRKDFFGDAEENERHEQLYVKIMHE